MSESRRKSGFAAKHRGDTVVDPDIARQIEARAGNNTLACVVAFDIADQCAVAPAAVGRTADLMQVRLVKCQLGLFGYHPRKKIVAPSDAIDPDLRRAVTASLQDGRLTCADAWRIARRFNVRKMTVSGVCEALRIKIKPCQLGAF